MPPTDNAGTDDSFQELQPSKEPPESCGPCRPSGYGFNKIKLPNLDLIVKSDEANGTTRKQSD
jgi:hypothetical protein